MASKPETSFYTSVHRFLPSPSQLHREKMANPYRGGTADHWYSGPVKDLWIEWKFILMPKRDDTVIHMVSGKNPLLSPLQQDWLSRRNAEGRYVWVVLGCKEGGIVFDLGQWAEDRTAGDLRRYIEPRANIAARIVRHTGRFT